VLSSFLLLSNDLLPYICTQCAGTGFELMDMLLCCKFAEGDSRILQMKLMRDRLKRVQKEGPLSTALSIVNGSGDGKEAMAALQLAQKLAPAGRDVQKLNKLMTQHWQDIYKLAELVEDRIIRNTKPASFVEGEIVDRLAGADSDFDTAWKSSLQHAGNIVANR
jgi:hypothetical protein